MFFFNDTATTEIYTLSLHDALPIYLASPPCGRTARAPRDTRTRSGGLKGGPAAERRGERLETPWGGTGAGVRPVPVQDRKSTRLNSSHANISYAVFCLKK